MRDAVDVFPPDIRPRSSYRVRTARQTRRRASPMTSSSSAALTARPRIFIAVPIIRRPASVSRLARLRDEMRGVRCKCVVCVIKAMFARL